MLREFDKQSILLLHLSGELPPDQQVRVRQMLADDSDLRAELSRLQSAVEVFESGMRRLDLAPLPAEMLVSRRVGKALRIRLAEKAAAAGQEAADNKNRPRYPMWAYPTAAAAVVLVALLSWWGHRPADLLVIKSPRPLNFPQVTPVPIEMEKAAAPEPAEGFEINANPAHEKDVASLEGAEEQVAKLTALSRDRTEVESSYFGVSDGNE